MKKRIFAFCLALCMAISMVPAYALEAVGGNEADTTVNVGDVAVDDTTSTEPSPDGTVNTPGTETPITTTDPSNGNTTGTEGTFDAAVITLKGSTAVRLGNHIYMHATVTGTGTVEGVTANWYVNGKRVKNASAKNQTITEGTKFDLTYTLPEDTDRETNKVTLKLSKDGYETKTASAQVETVFDFSGASITTSQKSSVAAGKTRRVKMTLNGMKKSIKGTVTWYVDGKKKSSKSATLSNGKTFTYSLSTKKSEAGTRNVKIVLASADGKRKLQQTKAITVMGQYDNMIASYSTSFDSSQTGRSTNLRLAMKAINGKVLQPGQTFSFNGTVGERTAARGYKMGYVYSGGQAVPGIGGGVCQVSSTLFNAVLLANLGIVERHYHSLTVSYVPLGRDATVLWNSKDFKFKNTLNYPIKLVTEYNASGKLTIKIMTSPSVSTPKVRLTVTRSGGYTLKRYVKGKCNYTTWSTYG